MTVNEVNILTHQLEESSENLGFLRGVVDLLVTQARDMLALYRILKVWERGRW